MQLSILKIILYILIPFAPLYARVVDFKGSLSHPWTMFPLFNIFPFSIVPILMMAFGKIKKGNGSKPYDHFMWIPIIFRFIASLLISMIIENPIIKTIVVLLLSILSIMVPNLIRRNKNCKDRKDSNNKESYSIISGKQWYRSFVDSLFELGIGEIFIVMMMFIPGIGVAFRLISKIPVIGKFTNDIIWSFGFTCGYIIINMYNQSNMKDMCYPEKLNTGNEITKLIIGLVCLLVGGFLSAKGQLKGFGKGGKMSGFGKGSKFKKSATKIKSVNKINKGKKKNKLPDMSDMSDMIPEEVFNGDNDGDDNNTDGNDVNNNTDPDGDNEENDD